VRAGGAGGNVAEGKKARGASNIIPYGRPPRFCTMAYYVEEPEEENDVTIPDDDQTVAIATDDEQEPVEEKKGPEEKKKGFDLKRKEFFLTYPQAGILTAQDIWDAYEQKWPMEVKGARIVKELHLDGSPHFHVILRFNTTMRIKRPDAFDVWGYHPNIQPLRSMKAATCYVHLRKHGKKGKVSFFGDEGDLDTSVPTNFNKKKADWEEWRQHLKRETLEDYTGQDITMGSKTFPIDMTVKKRHLWIYGAPDQGKSTLVEDAIYKYKVFKRKAKPYSYEGFQNHDIVWCDDSKDLDKEELCHMSGKYRIQTVVHGPTRNRCYYMPDNKNLLIIVCTNDEPLWLAEDWFQNRFFVWHVNEHGVWTQRN